MRREKQPPATRARRGRAEEIDQEVLEFIQAIDEFKRKQNKPFPSWSDILRILKELGYRKA